MDLITVLSHSDIYECRLLPSQPSCAVLSSIQSHQPGVSSEHLWHNLRRPPRAQRAPSHTYASCSRTAIHVWFAKNDHTTTCPSSAAKSSPSVVVVATRSRIAAGTCTPKQNPDLNKARQLSLHYAFNPRLLCLELDLGAVFTLGLVLVRGGNGHDALAAHGSDGVDELAAVVQRLDVVAAADGLAVDEDVGHGAAARGLFEGVLQARAEGVLVEFDDVGCGRDCVLFEEDVLYVNQSPRLGFLARLGRENLPWLSWRRGSSSSRRLLWGPS